MEVFQLSRRLIGKNGTSVIVPLCTAADEKVRDEFEAFEQKWLHDISACTVVVDTKQGPRVLMTVLNLLAHLGIDNIGLVKSQYEVKESALLQPVTPRIVLP